jgi:uncharacterized cupredoxin-like copper-binding protein
MMSRITLAACALLCGIANAAADQSASITVSGHKFSPSTVIVKAGEKIALSITNSEAGAIEFESDQLNREQVIPPGKTVTIYVGPLAPGSYPFFDDFNLAGAGKIIAK